MYNVTLIDINNNEDASKNKNPQNNNNNAISEGPAFELMKNYPVIMFLGVTAICLVMLAWGRKKDLSDSRLMKIAQRKQSDKL